MNVLLYYKFFPFPEFREFAEEHKNFCDSLGLRGRILVAPEGINGTCSGTVENTQKYMDYMRGDERFSGMAFKVETIDRHVFGRLSVKPKEELVTFRLEEEVKPYEMTAPHLSPKEFYAKMQTDDVIIIDGRSDYEYDLGHFRGARRPPLETFREFPDWIRKEFGNDKQKTILTYCTGGIRCEKLTAFMMREGFEDVYQLDGGIINYGQDETVRGQGWDGLCYVFDERISTPINAVDSHVVSKCIHCGIPCDRYVNCSNMLCNKQHFSCNDCLATHRHACSSDCRNAPNQNPTAAAFLREIETSLASVTPK